MNRNPPAMRLMVLMLTTLMACNQSTSIREMKAFNCNPISADVFQNEFERLNAKPLYLPGKEEKTFTARFALNLPATDAGHVLFVESMRLGGLLVYRGNFSQSFDVVVPSRLLDEQGLDNFSFVIANPGKLTMCTQMQDAAQRYWVKDAVVRIEFLESPRIDSQSGRPVRHITRSN